MVLIYRFHQDAIHIWVPVCS